MLHLLVFLILSCSLSSFNSREFFLNLLGGLVALSVEPEQV